MLQQSMRTLFVALFLEFKLNQYHPLTRVRTAYHDVAQQSGLCSQVKEADVVVDGIVANAVSDLIAGC